MTTPPKPVAKYRDPEARALFMLFVLDANFFVVTHTSALAMFFHPLIDGLQFWAATLMSALALTVARHPNTDNTDAD